MKRRSIRTTRKSVSSQKLLKTKSLKKSAKMLVPPDPDAPAKLQQLKAYEEALKHFQEQKYPRAKQALEKVLGGF